MNPKDNDDIPLRPVKSSYRDPLAEVADADDPTPLRVELATTSAGETPFSVFSRRQKVCTV